MPSTFMNTRKVITFYCNKSNLNNDIMKKVKEVLVRAMMLIKMVTIVKVKFSSRALFHACALTG